VAQATTKRAERHVKVDVVVLTHLYLTHSPTHAHTSPCMHKYF